MDSALSQITASRARHQAAPWFRPWVHLEESRTAQAGLFLNLQKWLIIALGYFSPRGCLPPHEGLRGPARLLIHSLLPFGSAAWTTLGYHGWPEYPEALVPSALPSHSTQESPREQSLPGGRDNGGLWEAEPTQPPGTRAVWASSECFLLREVSFPGLRLSKRLCIMRKGDLRIL